MLATRLLQTDAIPDIAYHVDRVFVKADRSAKGRGVTSLCVSVVDNDGRLDDRGYYHWRPHATHPDTLAAFAGARVPEYPKAVNTCGELQTRVPHLALVGWHDRTGVAEVFEWNGGHCDIKFRDTTMGPCCTGMNWEWLRI
jgi:hypothetical protein